ADVSSSELGSPAERARGSALVEKGVEVLRIDGLGHVGVEAGGHGLLSILGPVIARERDQARGSRLGRLASHPSQVISVDAGKADVDQGNLGLKGPWVVRP